MFCVREYLDTQIHTIVIASCMQVYEHNPSVGSETATFLGIVVCVHAET